MLISYCKAGLESEEFCLWVVAEPLTIEEAIDALKDGFANPSPPSGWIEDLHAPSCRSCSADKKNPAGESGVLLTETVTGRGLGRPSHSPESLLDAA
jgi:hypothetical protein